MGITEFPSGAADEEEGVVAAAAAVPADGSSAMDGGSRKALGFLNFFRNRENEERERGQIM